MLMGSWGGEEEEELVQQHNLFIFRRLGTTSREKKQEATELIYQGTKNCSDKNSLLDREYDIVAATRNWIFAYTMITRRMTGLKYIMFGEYFILGDKMR